LSKRNINLKESRPSRLIPKNLNKIRIKCPIANSCKDEIWCEDFKKHPENCKFKKARCLSCGYKVDLNMEDEQPIINHVTTCQEKEEDCKDCNKPIMKKNNGSHSVECTERIIECDDCRVIYRFSAGMIGVPVLMRLSCKRLRKLKAFKSDKVL
jgi:hypothetical protein